MLGRLPESGYSDSLLGTYLGRAEFGPRALGARSIIARADLPLLKQQLSSRLKRESIMPFSPVLATSDVLADGKSQHNLRFMTSAQTVLDSFKRMLGSASHVDGTVRAQVVDKHSPPLYFHLISEWVRNSGQVGLINTSFNLHEDPIVYSSDDVEQALRTGLVDGVLGEDGVFVRDDFKVYGEG